MAVSFDTTFEKGSSGQTSPFAYVSNAGTVAGTIGANSNRVLIGYVGFRGVAPTGVSMTWNGVAMTPIGSVNTTAGGNFDLFLFGLIAPATGAQTISVAWTGVAATIVLGAWSLYDADQSTGWQNFTANAATGTTLSSGTVTSANGNLVVCGTADNDATSATILTGTSDWDERAFSGNYLGGHIASVGSSAIVSWTLGSSVAWGAAAVDIIAFGAGADTLWAQSIM